MFSINNITVLIINKDESYIEKIAEHLYNTANIIGCNDVDSAVEKLLNEKIDFLLTDYSIIEDYFSIRKFTESFPETGVIIITDKPSYTDGSKALKQGALDYIDLEHEIELLPKKILDFYSDKKNKAKLKEKLFKNYYLESKNEKYLKVLSHCEKVAKTDLNVLLIGEQGTGKEVLAKYIHVCSPRISHKFISMQCSPYSEDSLERELFGEKEKDGKFELANKGTLFLDEVGDIGPNTQLKLLKVLETKKVSRIGSNKETMIDCKIISSTSKDLYTEVKNGNYRDDFFDRISSIVINVPPLRKRPEDLDQLIKYFLQRSQDEYGITIKSIAPEAKDFLYNYDYSGNLRELKTIIDRMVVLSVDGHITKDGIPILFNIRKEINVPKVESFKNIVPFREYKKDAESVYLQWVLDQTGGNVTEAARKLEISTRQLFNKINEYDLKK